ncbi:MAG: nucleotidyltransferase [Anaerolinea sp.]|nr:nucleotidyltransferase [Anaerolinea sp.]
MNYAQLINKRASIYQIAEKYGATRIRVFGSVARGDSDDKSDVDFLVTLEADRSLFDLGGLQFELQESLALPVDVITEDGLKGDARQKILAEAKEI